MKLKDILRIQSAYGCQCRFRIIKQNENNNGAISNILNVVTAVAGFSGGALSVATILDKISKKAELTQIIKNRKYTPIVYVKSGGKYLIPIIYSLNNENPQTFNLETSFNENFMRLENDKLLINKAGYNYLESIAMAYISRRLVNNESDIIDILSIGNTFL